jgi:hypothetical protein
LDKYKSDIISSEQQVPKSRDNESGEWEKIWETVKFGETQAEALSKKVFDPILLTPVENGYEAEIVLNGNGIKILLYFNN